MPAMAGIDDHRIELTGAGRSEILAADHAERGRNGESGDKEKPA
jgi:hypothetical protein